MKNKKPYWYRVLSHYERNHYYRNGLTIPFLIGARKKVEPGQPLFSIPEFLLELKSSSYSTTLMKCGDIHEYVFGLLDYETKKYGEKNKSVYRNFGSIVVTDGSFQDISNFNDFSSFFNDQYKDKVSNSIYSKIKGIWGDFDDTDNVRLLEVATMESG